MFFRDPSRNDSGDNLLGLVIAMFVFALLVPGLLVLLTRSQQLATASPDWDEGVAARAELAELFGSVDPVGQCASPSGGQDAAYRSSCFREERYAGASLVAVSAAELPAASPPVACWLTASDSGTRHRRCILLEGDTDEPECVNPPPVGPCLRVVSEVTGELVNVDRYGGGRMLVRSWDETDSDSDPDTVPFLPHEWAEPPTDRLIYQDVEWWCLRWREPNGSGSVTNWTGECPDPTDPAEWDDQNDAYWPQSTTPNPTPALPVAAAHLPAPADASGALLNPHTPGHRITDVEVQVCVASTYADRLQGASHCTVDTMRFSVADPVGETPPTPGFVPDSSVTSGGGVTVTESGAAESFGIRLATAPTATVTITVALAPPLAGVTVTPATLTFTTVDWQTPQTVTVDASGHNDPDAIDGSAAITLTAASTDSNYNGPIPPDIAVTVTDDDKPALIVDTVSVTVTEGSTADIMVRLQTAPAIAVTVAATSDDTAVVTVSPASLTFVAGTGQTAQTLTITGVDDADTANAAATVTLTATSVGVGYDGLTENIAVTVTDDDTPALTLTADSLTVPEGGTASVDVSLATLPSDSVTVTVASVDTAAATAAPSSLTFTTGDWNAPQTVTVSGTDDADYHDTTTTVSLTSSGGGYSGANASVAVTVDDDESCPPVGAPLADYATAHSLVVRETYAISGTIDADNPIPVAQILAFYWADGTTEFPLTDIASITVTGAGGNSATVNGIAGWRITSLTSGAISKLVSVTFTAGCTYTIPSP